MISNILNDKSKNLAVKCKLEKTILVANKVRLIRTMVRDGEIGIDLKFSGETD